MKEVSVTVFCTVYNHEKYLRRCLDGFVTQKTNFKYEILVHDDASTDGSADIIREYEKKYPEMIRPIYQTKNQYSQGVSIYEDIFLPLVRGKYVAFCEGDDYWCDENKLQLQYDAMEKHPDCRLCVHKVKRMDESGEKTLGHYPSFALQEGILLPEIYYEKVINYCAFQTSSYFYRSEDYRRQFQEDPEFFRAVKVGDIPTLLFCGTLGNIYYIDRVMSCYRYHSIGSWTTRMNKNKQQAAEHQRGMVRMYELFDQYSGGKYTALIAAKIKRLQWEERYFTGGKDNMRYVWKNADQRYWEEHSARFRLHIFLGAYCPWLMELYYKIKKR